MGSNFKRQLWLSFSIIIGGAAIVAVILYYLAGSISKAAIVIAADEALADKQTTALATVAGLKRQAKEAVAYQTSLAKLLPTQDGLIGFTEWLVKIAAAHQVAANATFGGNIQPPSGSSPGVADFSLSASGDANNLISFLDDIELKAPGFFLQLTSFDLVKQGGGYQLNGHGNLFFRNND